MTKCNNWRKYVFVNWLLFVLIILELTLVRQNLLQTLTGQPDPVKSIESDEETVLLTLNGTVSTVPEESLARLGIKEKGLRRLQQRNKVQSTIKSQNEFVSDYEPRYGKMVSEEGKIIVYNAVPKCGSRTLLSLCFEKFKERNISRPVVVLNVGKWDKQKATEKATAILKQVKSPGFIYGHLKFFGQKLLSDAIFINIIRDPYSRVISAYNFKRSGDDSVTGRMNSIQSIDECVLNNTCFGANMMLRMFCGYHPKCYKDPKWALYRAKENLDAYYTAVGIMEEYEDTIRVFERLLPETLVGFSDAYLSTILQQKVTSFKTKTQLQPSDKIKAIAMRKLGWEYMFYNYARNKFHQLKKELGINSAIDQNGSLYANATS